MPRRPRPFLHLVLILALLCQAVIPAGAMPAADRDSGTLTIEICTADGLRQVTLLLVPGDPGDPPHDPMADHDCWYACAGSPTAHALPIAAELPVSAAGVSHRAAISACLQPMTESMGPPLGARAPPLLSLD